MSDSPGLPPPRVGRNPAGLILLRKPVGVTSFQALGSVKRALGTKKVGHAGTLDRFASGLLVVFVGAYCRLASYGGAGEKQYRGLIAFGAETRTLDPEGEIVAEGPVPELSTLKTALGRFRGAILQRPPLFSAIHLDGRRAYERALAGEEPEMPERRVEIRELTLESYEHGVARVYVRCSPGTYIRSLARDIALACDTHAHLAELERLAVGPFRLADACDIDSFDATVCLRRIDAAASEELGLVPFAIGADMVSSFLHGREFSIDHLKPLSSAAFGEGGRGAVFDPEGELLGIVESRARSFVYRAVLETSESRDS
ncbi:MAG: tRNA pseudouridine(55) synthase TruB [Rectinemataceae bacterium]